MSKLRRLRVKQIKKNINIRVPENLHKFIKKKSIEVGISVTDIIIEYLSHLEKNKKKEKYFITKNHKVLNVDK